MTQNESRKLIAMIAARYPTPMLTQDSMNLWAEVIADLDYEPAKAAVMAWFRSHEERIDPAVLRRQVAGLQASALGSPYLDPDEAWALVETSFTKVGRNRQFPDDHPLVAEVVWALGWVNLCDSDNTVADRAHFTQLYRERVRRAREVDAQSPGARPLSAQGQRESVVFKKPLAEIPATREQVKQTLADLTAKLALKQIAPPAKPTEAAPAPIADITDEDELARRRKAKEALLAQVRKAGSK